MNLRDIRSAVWTTILAGAVLVVVIRTASTEGMAQASASLSAGTAASLKFKRRVNLAVQTIFPGLKL